MTTPLKLAGTVLRAIVVASLALAAAPAAAATITVNSLADTTGGAECTLRDAINAANTDMAAGGCPAGAGADTITFGVSGTITLVSSALPRVLDASTVTIDGTGQDVVISGNDAVPVFLVSGTVTLRALTIANAHSEENAIGGAATVFSSGTLIISRSTFSKNWSMSGGGAIANEGRLDIADSTFSGNSTRNRGGAVRSPAGTTRISGSTFVFNESDRDGDAVDSQGSLDIVNSTFGRNTNDEYVIFNDGRGSIINTTIIGNVAFGLGNGLRGTIVLANNFIADNARGDCVDSGAMTSVGTNLIADGSCNLQGALTGNAGRDMMGNYGGTTLTFALLPGSRAIDAGDSAVCATLPTDQRGSPRSVDGDLDGSAVCDLGAYEYSRLYDFNGFFDPVDNLPTVNAIKAGRAVPITFGLGGDQGLNIFAAGSPSSQRITCDSNAPLSDVEQTTTAGGSALSYDAATDRYTYVWKTDKAWAGTCRQLVVQLVDGTFHLASFRMK